MRNASDTKFAMFLEEFKGFINESTERDMNGWTIKDDMFSAYRQFCVKHGLETRYSGYFARYMKLIPYVRSAQKRIVGSSPNERHVWMNIVLRE
jgi:hypothetical protein